MTVGDFFFVITKYPMKEIWKDVGVVKGVDYSGYYSISNLGNVRKDIFVNNTTYKKSSKILKKRILPAGYNQIVLSKDKVSTYMYIHRLVLLLFIGDSTLECNHIDGDKSNNKLGNLEYCTRSENLKHKYRVLGYKSPMKGLFGGDNPTSKKVIQYDLAGNFIKKWDCNIDIYHTLGFHKGHISRCCNGFIKSSRGFIWRFEDNPLTP